MSEFIKFDNQNLQNDFEKHLGKKELTIEDFKIIKNISLQSDTDLSQHDVNLLLKTIGSIEFSGYSFSNMVFKGNNKPKIAFRECTFKNCSFDGIIIVTNKEDDINFESGEFINTRICIEISTIEDLLEIDTKPKEDYIYCFKKENSNQYYSSEEMIEISNKIKMIKKMIPNSISEFDKLLIISILLSCNMSYDYRGDMDSEEYKRLSDEEKSYHFKLTHSIKGILQHGIGVCEAMALSLSLLLDAINIKNRVVISKMHYWNQIKIDGEWYNYCITNLRDFFRDTRNAFIEEIFLTSDEKIQTLNKDAFDNAKKECNYNFPYDLENLKKRCNLIKESMFKYGLNLDIGSLSKDNCGEFCESIGMQLSLLDR